MHQLPVRGPNSAKSNGDRISRVQPTADRRFAGASSAVRVVGCFMGLCVRLQPIRCQIRDNRQIEREARQIAEETGQRLRNPNGRERVQKGQLASLLVLFCFVRLQLKQSLRKREF